MPSFFYWFESSWLFVGVDTQNPEDNIVPTHIEQEYRKECYGKNLFQVVKDFSVPILEKIHL